MHTMQKRTVQFYSILVGGLAVAGLFVSGHLLDLMNVDMALDAFRVVLAASLVYVGFMMNSERAERAILMVVAALYVGMGIVGLISPTIGGLLPSGLTGFDVAFHLVTGVLAGAVGAMKQKDVAKLVSN